ncbi:hypothetical protein GCM10010407_05000 [Rarobacter incanus]
MAPTEKEVLTGCLLGKGKEDDAAIFHTFIKSSGLHPRVGRGANASLSAFLARDRA